MINHANVTSDDAFGSVLQEKNIYQKYKHMIVKEEPRSRSKGEMNMTNMAGIISNPKALFKTKI